VREREREKDLTHPKSGHQVGAFVAGKKQVCSFLEPFALLPAAFVRGPLW
jgi:hypothetical protein